MLLGDVQVGKNGLLIDSPFSGTKNGGMFLVRRFLKLPQQALQSTAQLLTLAPKIVPDVKLPSTSIDTMSPDNPGLMALAELPAAPSIIAVKEDAVPPGGEDGVVNY